MKCGAGISIFWRFLSSVFVFVLLLFFFNALLHLIKFPGHSGIGNVKLKRVFAMSFPSEFSIQHMTKSVNFDAVICEILLDDNIAIW